MKTPTGKKAKRNSLTSSSTPAASPSFEPTSDSTPIQEQSSSSVQSAVTMIVETIAATSTPFQEQSSTQASVQSAANQPEPLTSKAVSQNEEALPALYQNETPLGKELKTPTGKKAKRNSLTSSSTPAPSPTSTSDSTPIQEQSSTQASKAPSAVLKTRIYIDSQQIANLYPEFKIKGTSSFKFKSFREHSSAWGKMLSSKITDRRKFTINGYSFNIWKLSQDSRFTYYLSASKGKTIVLHEAIIDEKTWHAGLMGYEILKFFCEIEHWHHVLSGLTSYFVKIASEDTSFNANCFGWKPVVKREEPNLWYYFSFCFFPSTLTEWHEKSIVDECRGVKLFQLR